MFEYLAGKIADKSPNTCVIDVGGVGYFVEIPVSTFAELPKNGGEARLLTHFVVREDSQKLYGFYSDAERSAFRKLIGISKIGPKVALAILSNLSVKDLAYAVVSGDAGRLKSIPGVGLKTAQRLVVELKGKLDAIAGEEAQQAGAPPSADKRAPDNIERQAFAAMVSLGYSETQVSKALARVRETLESEIPVEEWIRKALQVI
jgi:Holliday junction DNA helicase RuvA